MTDCCARVIIGTNKGCDGAGPPCVIKPDVRVCSSGILNGDVCCKGSCGSCGGLGCHERNGGEAGMKAHCKNGF
jgi:hypothetical protein